MMFSHAMVVGLLSMALWAAGHHSAMPSHVIKRPAQVSGRHGHDNRKKAVPIQAASWVAENRWELMTGVVCGGAIASEYSAGLVIAGILLWRGSLGLGRILPFCVGTAVPALLIPAYSVACFGNPFTLPYSLQASYPGMEEGLFGIKWPSTATAYNLLFSPERGLFYWTPFLLMAGLGYRQLICERRPLFWLTYLVPLLHLIVISGRSWDWQAGPTLGPRLLSPVIPLLALPCALGLQRFSRLGLIAAAYSILITTLATLTNACPPFDRYPNPLFDLHIPLLLKGDFSPNLGLALGVPPHASVILFYAVLILGTWWLWWQIRPAVAHESGRHDDDRA
jgi:hypothetical protein